MPILILKTLLNAPIAVCFDLARSIDLHVQSMERSGEQAIAGKKKGLISLHESVTWRAKHFGIYFTMTSKITAMEQPNFFIDEMTKGPFKKLRHQHLFKTIGTQTEMTDIFEFEAPFGILGKLVEQLFLKSYMEKLLIERNEVLKGEAERRCEGRGLEGHI
jgi:ligand-binding SRPBCC domain-containing protein